VPRNVRLPDQGGQLSTPIDTLCEATLLERVACVYAVVTNSISEVTEHVPFILVAPTGRTGIVLVRRNDGRAPKMPREQFAVGWTEHRHNRHVKAPATWRKPDGIDADHHIKRRN
jgi:hypothetical protein